MTAASKTKPLLLAIGAFVALAAVGVAYRFAPALRGHDPVAAAPDAGVAPSDLIVDEAERVAYVASSVTVGDLVVGPDARPGEDAGIVEGLLRVTGTVANRGDRALRTVKLVVNPLDAAGQVLGSHGEDVLGGKRLGPGESRAFKFVIPKKREYSGKFEHHLR